MCKRQVHGVFIETIVIHETGRDFHSLNAEESRLSQSEKRPYPFPLLCALKPQIKAANIVLQQEA